MKVILNIDEEIFDNEVKNKFNDFWNRVIVDLVDVKTNDNFENLYNSQQNTPTYKRSESGVGMNAVFFTKTIDNQ